MATTPNFPDPNGDQPTYNRQTVSLLKWLWTVVQGKADAAKPTGGPVIVVSANAPKGPMLNEVWIQPGVGFKVWNGTNWI